MTLENIDGCCCSYCSCIIVIVIVIVIIAVIIMLQLLFVCFEKQNIIQTLYNLFFSSPFNPQDLIKEGILVRWGRRREEEEEEWERQQMLRKVLKRILES